VDAVSLAASLVVAQLMAPKQRSADFCTGTASQQVTERNAK
jgi:hypothetical protein